MARACRIECSSCGKWRIISYAKMTEAKDTEWVCRLLRYAVQTHAAALRWAVICCARMLLSSIMSCGLVVQDTHLFYFSPWHHSCAPRSIIEVIDVSYKFWRKELLSMRAILLVLWVSLPTMPP